MANDFNVNLGGIYDDVDEKTTSANGRKSQSTKTGKKPVLNCRFPIDIYDYIDQLAIGDGMTKTAVLMGIVREYRATHPERLQNALENMKKYNI